MLKVKQALLFIVIFATASAAMAQTGIRSPVSKLFDAALLLRDIETLSSDEMEGRSPAQPSIAKAREYVKRRFAESGLEPIGADFEQPFESLGRRRFPASQAGPRHAKMEGHGEPGSGRPSAPRVAEQRG